jgi:hypothetical protein
MDQFQKKANTFQTPLYFLETEHDIIKVQFMYIINIIHCKVSMYILHILLIIKYLIYDCITKNLKTPPYIKHNSVD